MNNPEISKRKLIKMVLVRVALVPVLFAVIIFLPAGTLDYWQAWIYMLILFIPMVMIINYLIKNDLELLYRRMKFKEKEKQQKRVISYSFFIFILIYLVPAFDRRYGWSSMVAIVVIAGEIIVLIGYGLVFLVFRENSYATRTVEVEKGQKVIQTGPYAVVRHPMYSGIMLMYLFSPIALGSYWGLIPGVFLIPIFAARIVNEEKVLLRDLKGYKEYLKKTPYRILPGIW